MNATERRLERLEQYALEQWKKELAVMSDEALLAYIRERVPELLEQNGEEHD